MTARPRPGTVPKVRSEAEYRRLDRRTLRERLESDLVRQGFDYVTIGDAVCVVFGGFRRRATVWGGRP